MHMKNNEIKFYSRNSHDVTHLYGPKLSPQFDSQISSCILDGEVIVWDTLLDTHVQFGKNKTIA